MGPLLLLQCVLDHVLDTIVNCGAGRRECVVYVTATLDEPCRAVGSIHPAHAATSTSTEVPGEELDRVWDELQRRHEQIVMQVHSHPGGAHHSGVDDRWPVVHRVGFPSLVVARFGERGVADAHLAVYLGAGRWKSLVPGEWQTHVVIEGGGEGSGER